MKKTVLFLALLGMAFSLFGYGLNDLIDMDYSWTDSNAENHSIHELVDSGIVVVLFWGGYG